MTEGFPIAAKLNELGYTAFVLSYQIGGCADDPLVNPAHWPCLKEALDKAGVPAILEIGETGGHGYGLGRNTSVKGWLERAVQFMERSEQQL